MKYDVIIIGAGYAGLSAANELFKQKKSFCILEARDRVGGRVYTKQLDDNTYVDLGGAWVGANQDHFYKLIKETGHQTFPTYDTGRSTLYFEGKIKTYKGIIPPLPLGALLSLDFAIKRINKLSRKVNLEAPWDCPLAQKYDQMSLGDWMLKQMRFLKARELFKIAAEAIFATDVHHISMLHAMFYTRSGRDFDTLMNVKNGAQEERIVGGAMQPALSLASIFSEHVKLNSEVKKIENTGGGVKVMGDNFSFEAQKVIIAMPPYVAKNITFVPALPSKKASLMENIPMGSVVKTYVIYKTPFWRKAGLNGLAASNQSLNSVIFDNSPKDASHGILMGFVLANQTEIFMAMSEADRKAHVINSYVQMFGPEANDSILYLDHSWKEETFTAGCYAGYFEPHTWTRFGDQIRIPCGHIHWAGTETATVWNGYIDGAISSGIRAANEVIGLINKN